jgi:hypothetical protein
MSVQIQRGSDDKVLHVQNGGGADFGGGGGMVLTGGGAGGGGATGAIPIAAPIPQTRQIGVTRPSLGVTRAPRPMPPRRPLPPPTRGFMESLASEGADDIHPDTINEFANPNKKRDEDYDGGDDDDDGMDGGDGFDDGDYDDGGGDDDVGDDGGDDGGAGSGGFVQSYERPSAGYASIEEEKADLLFKLARFKRQGATHVRAMTVYTDIRELRAEFARLKTEVSLDGSIKTSRQILMAVVSSLEFLNKRYDPFDFQLDGWSGQVHESITDYNDVFEKLFYKYRNKISAPPELQLMLMVGGSALMFHMSNAIFKSSMLPKMQASPETLANVMRAFQPGAAAAPPAPPPVSGNPGDPREMQEPQRREMRGPGMDVSGMMGGLGGLGGMAGMMGGLGGGGGLGNTGLGGGGLANMGGGGLANMGVAMPQLFGPGAPALGNGPGAPASSRPGRPVQGGPGVQGNPGVQVDDAFRRGDDASERLSDVLSDELESVPDDLQSLGSSDNGRRTFGGGPPRGRKRAKTTAANKKIVTIS